MRLKDFYNQNKILKLNSRNWIINNKNNNQNYSVVILPQNLAPLLSNILKEK